jgi:hypothetical protein
MGFIALSFATAKRQRFEANRSSVNHAATRTPPGVAETHLCQSRHVRQAIHSATE